MTRWLLTFKLTGFQDVRVDAESLEQAVKAGFEKVNYREGLCQVVEILDNISIVIETADGN